MLLSLVYATPGVLVKPPSLILRHREASTLRHRHGCAFIALSPVNLSMQFTYRHPEEARKYSLPALIFGTLPDDDI